jgi:tRNA-specific 2-thiouridylase
MEKRDVRALAAELGLVTAGKPDSQDICFVPDGDYARVVAKLRPDAMRPGEIVDGAGNVLGTHEGVIHYTVGQRKGLGLSGNEAPLFVLKLDAPNARVVVGPRDALRTRAVFVRDLNWLVPPGRLACAVKVRSTRPAVEAVVMPCEDGAWVELLGFEEAVAPGQACVFYDGSRVLGGGTIAQPGAARTAA